MFSSGFLFSSGRNLKSTGEFNNLKINIWLNRCCFCSGMKLDFFSRAGIIAIICTRVGPKEVVGLFVCLFALLASEGCFYSA